MTKNSNTSSTTSTSNMNEVFLVDNVLSIDECDYCIDYFKINRNENNTQNWRNTTTMLLNLQDKKLKTIVEKITQFVHFNYNNEIKYDYGQIVMWPTGTNQFEHTDVPLPNKKDSVSLTSISYLNDDFEGGQTFFEHNNNFVVPVKGTTVYFDGQKIVHGVNKITKNTRYTLPIWYKKNGTNN